MQIVVLLNPQWPFNPADRNSSVVSLFSTHTWFYECVMLELEENMLFNTLEGSSSEINCCTRACQRVYNL